jgi:hypothetical protein
MPTVPKAAAFELCGAPSKTGALQVMAKFANPAPSTTD